MIGLLIIYQYYLMNKFFWSTVSSTPFYFLERVNNVMNESWFILNRLPDVLSHNEMWEILGRIRDGDNEWEVVKKLILRKEKCIK